MRYQCPPVVYHAYLQNCSLAKEGCAGCAGYAGYKIANMNAQDRTKTSEMHAHRFEEPVEKPRATCKLAAVVQVTILPVAARDRSFQP